MVLIGILRQHPVEFSFVWQLSGAVATETLWKERNKCKFQGASPDLSGQQAELCLFRIARMLKMWPGKIKGEAKRIAGIFFEKLIDARAICSPSSRVSAELS
eukprot:c31112_g1_i1 orf=24-329(-)